MLLRLVVEVAIPQRDAALHLEQHDRAQRPQDRPSAALAHGVVIEDERRYDTVLDQHVGQHLLQ